MSLFDRVPQHVVRHGLLAADELAVLQDWAFARAEAVAPPRVWDSQQGGARLASDFWDALSFPDFPGSPQADLVTRRVAPLVPAILDELGVASFEPHYDLSMIAYRDSGRLRRHIDTSVGHGAHPAKRVVSLVYYFHREDAGFTGGALRLFPIAPDAPGMVEIVPRPNMLVGFLSFAPHEVTGVACASPRIEDARLSINIWLHRTPLAGTSSATP